MPRFHRLSTRLVLAMLLPLAALLLSATVVENHFERKAMIAMAETGAVNLSQSVVEELQGILRSTRSAIDGVSIPLEYQNVPDEQGIDELVVSTIKSFPLIFGSAIALDPDVNGEHTPLVKYHHRDGHEIVDGNIDAGEYHYWERPGYQLPTQAGEGVWIQPYFDTATGEIPMVTYARPIAFLNRAGVLTADVPLKFLSVLMDSNVLGQNGSVIIFDAMGRTVTHPKKDWILKRSLARVALEQDIPVLETVAGVVSQGETLWLRPKDGMHEGMVGGAVEEAGRMYVRPLNEAGWGVAVYFSDHTFLAAIDESTRYKVGLAFLVMLLLAFILWVFSVRGLRPLAELSERTRAIARGDFEAPPVIAKTADEVGRLSNAFNTMQEHLQHYVADLTKATAEKERMAGELATAAQIQQMLLPAEHPLESDLHLQVVAKLRPASQVGGDLYFYKLLPGNRLMFAIGDVSDKGVPAALFMARAMSVLKAASLQNLSPARVLGNVNQALVEDNEICMFVTLLVGELSLDTGQCYIASAGHENPIKINEKGVKILEVETGMPVGLEADEQYKQSSLSLNSHDYLFIYTDGITEAKNNEGSFFGDHRLHESLKLSKGDTPEAVMAHTLKVVEGFVGDAKQSDDMTMLVLQCGAINVEQQQAGATTGSVTYFPIHGCQNQVFNDLSEAINEAPGDFQVPDELQLVVEELVTNVVKYSGVNATEPCRVNWQLMPSVLELHFEDQGVAVDPLQDYTLSEGDDRAGGGMGLELVKAMTDGVSYSRLDDWNRMTVWFGEKELN